MKLPRRKFLHLSAGAAALPAASRIAWAETYPSRPITVIVREPLTHFETGPLLQDVFRGRFEQFQAGTRIDCSLFHISSDRLAVIATPGKNSHQPGRAP
jgi:hypothetical protein